MELLRSEHFDGTMGGVDRYTLLCELSRLHNVTLSRGTLLDLAAHPCRCAEYDQDAIVARAAALEAEKVRRANRNSFLDRTLTVGQRQKDEEHAKEPPIVRHYRSRYQLENFSWVACDGEHYLLFVGLVPGGFELVTIDKLAIEDVLECSRNFIGTKEGAKEVAHAELRAALINPAKDYLMVADVVRDLFRLRWQKDAETRTIDARYKSKPGGGLDTGQL